MQRFLHSDVRQLTGLLEAAGDAFRRYNSRDPGLEQTLHRLLDDAGRTYRDQGRRDRETRLLSLAAELTTAGRGVNPLTLETVSNRRHELRSTVAFRVLQALEVDLRTDLHEPQMRLQHAEELLGQILIAGIQKGLLTDAVLHDAATQPAIEALWALVATDPELALAQKRVLLMVSIYDVIVLLGKLLTALGVHQ